MLTLALHSQGSPAIDSSNLGWLGAFASIGKAVFSFAGVLAGSTLLWSDAPRSRKLPKISERYAKALMWATRGYEEGLEGTQSLQLIDSHPLFDSPELQT